MRIILCAVKIRFSLALVCVISVAVKRQAMNRQLLWLLTTLFLASGSLADAKQAKVPKIGLVRFGAGRALASGSDLFRRELRALGYVEGKNIAFESRYAEGEFDRLPGLVDELVRLKVDVLVTTATPSTLAAKNASKTIPIVFYNVADPVAAGLVDSLARPGGNLTGFTIITAVLAGKRLEMLKEAIPKLSRVTILWNPQNPGNALNWKESQLPARELGLQLHSMEVSSADKYKNGFKEAINARSAALAVMQDPLMSYGADQTEPFKRVASMVDKILKGAKPADLPVEQPTKFEFIINLKATKQIGLTIPPNVLARADRVIR